MQQVSSYKTMHSLHTLQMPPPSTLTATTRLMWCQSQRAELLSSSHEWALTCWAGSRRQSPSEDDAVWQRESIQHFFISFQSSRTPGAATLKMCRVLPILIKTLHGGHRPGHDQTGAAQGLCQSRGRRAEPCSRRRAICCLMRCCHPLHQNLKLFFFDTEIKGNPDKFKSGSSTVPQWDEPLSYKLPSQAALLDFSWEPVPSSCTGSAAPGSAFSKPIVAVQASHELQKLS